MSVKNTTNFNKAADKMMAAVQLYGETAALQLEAQAKKEARWIDRTTNARNSIQGEFSWKGKNAVVTLSGNVNYFVYLELGMEKRYSILVPTIKRNAAEIRAGYQRIVK